jgi:hypothetical protein
MHITSRHSRLYNALEAVTIKCQSFTTVQEGFLHTFLRQKMICPDVETQIALIESLQLAEQ